RNPAERAWGCPSVVPSSMLMEAACGRTRTNLAARYFTSPCPDWKASSRFLVSRLTRRESGAKTPFQTLFIHRLAKVTQNPVLQGAGLVNIIGVGSNQNCRNRVARIDEVSVEYDPGHLRHMDVGDQASRFGETRGCEEFD